MRISCWCANNLLVVLNCKLSFLHFCILFLLHEDISDKNHNYLSGMSRGEFLFCWPQMSPWNANASYFSYPSSEKVVWLFCCDCYWHISEKGTYYLPRWLKVWTKTHQNWFRINQANISILDSKISNQIMPGASCWVPKCWGANITGVFTRICLYVYFLKCVDWRKSYCK